MTAPLPPPPPSAAQPIAATTIVPRNGYGITALTLALVGLVFGLVPLTGFLALILGALAVLFGLLGWARARRGEANNPRMAPIGTALGVCSAALGIWGITIVFGTVDDLDRAFNGQGGIGTALELPNQPESGDVVNQLPFGQSFTYEDGTTISVAAPTHYEPSSSAAISGTTPARAVAMKVTVTNGTAKLLDLAGVNLQVAAGEHAAEQIYDSANGVGAVYQTLPPNKRHVYTVAYGLPAGATELRVQVMPGWFGYQPVFFVGSA